MGHGFYIEYCIITDRKNICANFAGKKNCMNEGQPEHFLPFEIYTGASQ